MKLRFQKMKRSVKHLLRDFSSIFEEYEEIDPDGAPFYCSPVTHKVDVELTFTLTNDDIESIMHTALKGGVKHWCRNVELTIGWTNRPLHEQIPRYGTLRFCDVDDNVHDLTLEKFLAGLRLFYINGGDVERKAEGRIDIRDIGKSEADAIIQYALFGKIIHEHPKKRRFLV